MTDAFESLGAAEQLRGMLRGTLEEVDDAERNAAVDQRERDRPRLPTAKNVHDLLAGGSVATSGKETRSARRTACAGKCMANKRTNLSGRCRLVQR
jgi:hypothetical protein